MIAGRVPFRGDAIEAIYVQHRESPMPAKLMGGNNAVKKGKIGQRVGRRAAGNATGKAMRKLFK
jgi:hypothetical protein